MQVRLLFWSHLWQRKQFYWSPVLFPKLPVGGEKPPKKVEVGEKKEVSHENLRDWLLSNSSQCRSRSWGPTKLWRNLFHGKTQQTSTLFQPVARHSWKNTALKWQPEAWAWMNILFTASISVQLQDKVTLIKTMVLRTYKTTFIWSLIIRYKQYGSVGEISPSKEHVAPRGSPAHWGPAGTKSCSSWQPQPTPAPVEQLEDPPMLVALPVKQANRSVVPMSAKSINTGDILKSKTSTLSSSAPPKGDFTLSTSYLAALSLSQKSIWDAAVDILVHMGALGYSEIWVLHETEVSALSGHEFFIITLLAFPIHTLLENSKAICCTNKIQPRVTCKLVSVIYRAICFLYWLQRVPLKVWSNT